MVLGGVDSSAIDGLIVPRAGSGGAKETSVLKGVSGTEAYASRTEHERLAQDHSPDVTKAGFQSPAHLLS